MIWNLVYVYLISTILVSVSLSIDPLPISTNHKLIFKRFNIVLPQDGLTYLEPYSDPLAFNQDRQRINDYVLKGPSTGDQRVEYGDNKDDRDNEGSYDGYDGVLLDDDNISNNHNNHGDGDQRQSLVKKDLKQLERKRSSVMLNRLGFALHKAAHNVPRYSADREYRSGEVGGSKFSDKPGSKDNLLVKCFFNSVSCF